MSDDLSDLVRHDARTKIHVIILTEHMSEDISEQMSEELAVLMAETM